MEITKEEVKRLIAEIGCADDQLNYSEFISAALDEKTLITDTKLRAIFTQIDVKGAGVITEADLYNALKNIGWEVSNERVSEIVRAYDY